MNLYLLYIEVETEVEIKFPICTKNDRFSRLRVIIRGGKDCGIRYRDIRRSEKVIGLALLW